MSTVPMLAGLSRREFGLLGMSVGYGTHRKGRPLSPIEVGTLLQRARKKGATISDCAKALRIHQTGIARYLRILDLPSDIKHLIDWGAGTDYVGYSAAFETTRLKDVSDQRAVAAAIMAHKFTSHEVREVVQLRQRSGQSISGCIQQVIQMRPVIVRRYVFIGTIAPDQMEGLRALTQSDRDLLFALSLKKAGLDSASGRLGVRFFTLIGDDQFDCAMRKIGAATLEVLLRNHIAAAVKEALSGSRADCLD